MSTDSLYAHGAPGRTTETTADPHAILEALDDATCRQIIDRLRTARLTAQEVASECDIPQSTTYRKLDLLTDAGLLTATIRLAPSENNPTEYTTAATGATIHLDEDGEFVVELEAVEGAEGGSGVAVLADD
jgi:DNA-binding transcriptional ArsR family regulator